MEGLKRLIDANLNRASEGIRVLEDISRFMFNNSKLTGKLKEVRHDVRKSISEYAGDFISFRDSIGDVGPSVSEGLKVDGKANVNELVTANFKRTQEALRSIEEALKVLGMEGLSRNFEKNRYAVYTLEKEFFGALKSKDKHNVLNTELYCITSEEHSMGRDNIEVVRQMLASGVKLIQYREKEKSMIEKYRQCIKIRDLTYDAGAVFIVNDHMDIAKSVMADGVHLGQDDMPLEAARQVMGDSMIIGISTHSPEQAMRALDGGADYIGVGPIFKTFTKKDVCDPVGFEYLDYVVKNINIPFVAIGGIKLHNLKQVSERGAKCAALVTEIVGAEDIGKVIMAARNIMEGAV